LSTGADHRRRLSELADPLLLPGALAVAVFLVFAVEEAGYPPTIWYPGALFLVALTALALPPLLARPARAVIAAAALLLGFTAWSFASIAWSEVRGDAWDGANRTLLYLVVFVLFALLPWRAGTIAALLGAWSVGVAALGAIFLARAADAANPDAYFLLGRFAEPAGYQNANCALFLMAFFPAVFLASRPEVPAVLRGTELAAAAVLLELALLTQTRTSVVALPVTVLVFLMLVPARVRTLAFLVPPAVAAAVTSGRLLDVFPAIRDDEAVGDALAAATGAIWFTAVTVFAAGLVAAVIDRRLAIPDRVARVTGRALGAASVLAVVVAAVAVAAGAGDVRGRLDRAWDEFRMPQLEAHPTASYFSSGFGGNRYDIWRVALGEFRRAPLHGVGADNFSVAYLRERRTSEEPLYPHSLELRVLSQTGLVGAVLFAGFLAAACAAVLPLRRRSSRTRGVGAAAVAVFAYWLVHGSVDWFWEIPGLAAPAVAALGAAASLPRVPAPGHARPRLRGIGIGAGVLAVVGAATLAPPWLSAKEVQAAAGGWRTEPEAAFDRLERARALNPLSDNPDLVAGAIASRLGDRARMRVGFERALERNPHNWYAYFELAVVTALGGNREEALRLLDRARALAPREPAIALVSAQVRAGRQVSPAGLDRLFLRRTDPEYGLQGRD
jgi:tetratricopeptide (TPR) repeat protein